MGGPGLSRLKASQIVDETLDFPLISQLLSRVADGAFKFIGEEGDSGIDRYRQRADRLLKVPVPAQGMGYAGEAHAKAFCFQQPRV